jgi:hypothetical protein
MERTEQVAITSVVVSGSTAPTIQDIYTTYRKWFYIEDTNRIDIGLTVLISQKIGGLPIWIFLCGPSGDFKSTQISTLAVKDTIRIDKLTSRTLVSGKALENEFVNTVWGKTILIYDFAEVMSKDPTEKRAIFAQWRNLYDGKAGGSYGTGKIVTYTGRPPYMIVGCTPAINDEFLLSQELGTRELIYRVDTKNKDEARKRAIELQKSGLLAQAIAECQDIVARFIASRPINAIDVPEQVQDQIEELTDKLAFFRASARIDQYTGELCSDPVMEIPTRVSMQFAQIYKALKTLDDNYTDETALEILKRIVDSSGDPITMKVYRCLETAHTPLSTNAVAKQMRLGYKTVYGRLNLLYALDAIEMTMELDGDKMTKHWFKKATASN